MIDQRDAERRDLEERYAADSFDHIKAVIHGGNTAPVWINIIRYIDEQVATIKGVDEAIDQFYSDVDHARNIGVSSREIWGDGQSISFPESMDYKRAMANANIGRLMNLLGINEERMGAMLVGWIQLGGTIPKALQEIM